MMLLNCDIGERGPENQEDHRLMEYIGMANIACGGHAGDAESVRVFRKAAELKNIKISAHISYPDRENFGRFSMNISRDELSESLSEQLSMLPGVGTVKFHGALYNDCNVNRELSDSISLWLKNSDVKEIVTPFDSELAASCRNRGIDVIAEAFAERRYDYNPDPGRLTLVSRKKDYASITDVEEAIGHSLSILKDKKVSAFIESEGTLERRDIDIEADTICIHSDSKISLDLAKRLSRILQDIQHV